MKTRVLIVDDSAVVRKVLTTELSKFGDIEVVGSAMDPYVARDKIIALRPDVLTLDVEMPRMDGLTFLTNLMNVHPMPVIVVSSVTPERSEAAIQALTLGAVDVICKPGTQFTVGEVTEQLVRAIRAAAHVRPGTCRAAPPPVPIKEKQAPRFQLKTTHKVLALGASTGGTVAIERVLVNLPVDTPGAVIVQHMPENFTAAFAKRLNGISAMEIREARDGDSIVPGVALLAPGNRHMVLARSGARYHVRIKGGPAVHHQRPSVDVLFHSLAQKVGSNAVGVLMTGMGADGAEGMLAMREAGSHTIAEHESTCVVYGMPKEAIELGAAAEIVRLPNITDAILRSLGAGSRPVARAAAV